jgi:hypothetical protein
MLTFAKVSPKNGQTSFLSENTNYVMTVWNFTRALGLSLALAAALTACGGDAANSNAKEEGTAQAKEQGMEYTAAYICPMHCEGSGSDQPGECPVCGMDYVKNEGGKAPAQPAEEGGHDHSHDGHDHSHDGHSH